MVTETAGGSFIRVGGLIIETAESKEAVRSSGDGCRLLTKDTQGTLPADADEKWPKEAREKWLRLPCHI